MKIRVDDIPEGGMEIDADSASAPWLKSIFLDLLGQEKFKKDDNGRVNLKLFKDNRDVTIVGGVVFKWHPICDRCLSVFSKHQQAALHQVMSPESEAKIEDDSEPVEDEDYGYYKGGEINLASVVREYVILSQQMVNLCRDDCRGLCPRCGRDLNKGSCNCPKKEDKDSPFAMFKGMKFKKTKTSKKA